MTPLALASFALGVVGALAHLVVTRWRAQLVVAHRGAVASAFALYPLGLVGPAAAVLLAIALGPKTVWAVPLGIWLTRMAVLRRTEEDVK